MCLLLLEGHGGGFHELGGFWSGVLEAVAKHWRALLGKVQVMALKHKQITDQVMRRGARPAEIAHLRVKVVRKSYLGAGAFRAAKDPDLKNISRAEVRAALAENNGDGEDYWDRTAPTPGQSERA